MGSDIERLARAIERSTELQALKVVLHNAPLTPCGHGLATRIDTYNHDYWCDDDQCTKVRLDKIAAVNEAIRSSDPGFAGYTPAVMEDLRHAKLARRFNALLRGE